MQTKAKRKGSGLWNTKAHVQTAFDVFFGLKIDQMKVKQKKNFFLEDKY